MVGISHKKGMRRGGGVYLSIVLPFAVVVVALVVGCCGWW